uniref:Doublecortin domain-containing protein n=1 Tax=Caenorhabditis japonica TaxID=281687 RepID=A0A8R1DQB6_CAEJA
MPPVQPQNGTIRTFDNPTRTFTRPYSAKTVIVYKDGDNFFTGIRMAVSHHRYKTLHNLMDDLNRFIYLPYGVRTLSHLMGREVITSIDQLQHLGKYVASSFNPPAKSVDLNKIHLSATLRQEHGRSPYFMPPPSSPPPPSLPPIIRSNNRAPPVSIYHLYITQPSKEVLVCLNGAGQFYRALINPIKVPSMEKFLDECTEGLKTRIDYLYTPDGKRIHRIEDILEHDGPRIIACPKGELPHLSENNFSKLPEINPNRYAPRIAYAKVIESNSSFPRIVAAATQRNDSNVSTGNNSIEKRERLPPITNRYIPRKQRPEPSISSGSAPSQQNGTKYTPKTYIPAATSSTRNVRKPAPAPAPSKPQKVDNVTTATAKTKMKKSIKTAPPPVQNNTDTAKSSATNSKDSGYSFRSGSQSEKTDSSARTDRAVAKAKSETERKAQMIRQEMESTYHNQSGSDQIHSEEDHIVEEEDSDYEHVARPIQSGTSEESDSALSSTTTTTNTNNHKRSPTTMSRVINSSTSTVTRRTPSSSSSEHEQRAQSTKSVNSAKSFSREDTPYQRTPSRTSTISTTSTHPASSHLTSHQNSVDDDDVIALSDVNEEPTSGSDTGEEAEEETEAETPAIHTPDTRVQTAASLRSFESESSKAWSRISGYSDKEQILPSDDEDGSSRDVSTADRERAAKRIQVAYKKYTVRKKQVVQYTIEFVLGDRFGIDFNTRLFVILYGENGEKSEKIFTQKVDWLFDRMDYYEPKQWIVINTNKIKKLGIITSVDVGHDKIGYGAGTFIDRVVVTENILENGRRFLFNVEKWFDSGQVDGVIERNMKISSFLYMKKESNIPDEAKMTRVSKGRWEFRLHTMQNDLGGTTSNLTVIGYGTYDSNANLVKNDSLLRDPYSIPLIQIDFGTDIGSLRKVRFEIDGVGDKPNYYLEYVEAMDLDTQERCVLMVNNWLLIDAQPGYKKYQWFREVAIFTMGYHPSPVKTYEGTITFADKSLLLGEDTQIYLQYYADSENNDDISHDASGIFPVVPTKMKNGNINYTYKVDFVTMNVHPRIRVIPQITKLGTDILGGMSILRDVYADVARRTTNDFVEIIGESSLAKELFIETIHQKTGDHTPFQSYYANSTIDFEQNNRKGPYFKQLWPIRSAPYSTARKYKKSEEQPKVEDTATWQLSMCLRDMGLGTPAIPAVVLVGRDRSTFEMECQMSTPSSEVGAWFLKYSCTARNFGNPHKLRVSTDANPPDTQTYLHKNVIICCQMLLEEVLTGTTVFFKVDSEVAEYETLELECTYPDVGGGRGSEYDIVIRTLKGGGDFHPYINLIGEFGDTGFRAYNGVIRYDKTEPMEMFNIMSMTLGSLKSLEIWAKNGTPKNWKGSVRVTTSEELIFESGVLELSKNGQIAVAEMKFLEEIAPVVLGESYL